ncbi:MAG: hydroxymethylglutaryl-CoA lyase [Candidatus Eisenbacteria bacterium]|nr:hydroxymethylglutaryl-CoA lyase [Candidatus Eisenbacteria bacterium]
MTSAHPSSPSPGHGSYPERVRIVEVGPRDGLQNEALPVPTETKVAYVDALSAAGFGEIEVTSFVHPKLVPQLADASAVLAGIERRPGVVYSALVPNPKGLERAVEAGVDRIAVFTAASETFNQKNINATIAESIDRFRPVMDGARAAGIPVRGYVSTAFVCPFEGEIPVGKAVDVIEQLLDLGVDEISIGDTIGAAVPLQVHRLLEALGPILPLPQTTMHFHDTRGTGLANVLASLEHGVAAFDAASGGLGGCPFAPGASGNLATEDLVYLLHGLGIQTGLDPAALRKASDVIELALGWRLPSRVRRAGPASVSWDERTEQP